MRMRRFPDKPLETFSIPARQRKTVCLSAEYTGWDRQVPNQSRWNETGAQPHSPSGQESSVWCLILRIENIVLDEFKASAVILISSASRHYIDCGGSRAAKLRIIVRSLHVHFLNEIIPTLIEYAVVRSGVQVKPTVHAPVLPIQSLPVGDRDAVVVVCSSMLRGLVPELCRAAPGTKDMSDS